MIALIIGGSASGKSEFAENLTLQLSKHLQTDSSQQFETKRNSLLYIATMKPFDNECLIRIDRHREMRKYKGFDTKEIYTGLCEASFEHDAYTAVLLECMSNLLANEMYSIYPPDEHCCDRIIAGIDRLTHYSTHTIIVSNEVFCDGDSYSDETLLYINQLGEINRRIAEKADIVVEVICGIPIYHKNLQLQI